MFKTGTREVPQTKEAANAMQFSSGNWLEDTTKYVRSMLRLSGDAWSRIFDAALEYAGTPSVAMTPVSDGELNNPNEDLIVDNYSADDTDMDSEDPDPISDADNESGWTAA